MASYLITGASRAQGIGLALAQALAQDEQRVKVVFATSRKATPAVEDLVKKSSGRVVHILLDTTDKSSVKAAAAEVEKHLQKLSLKGLDVLINNAGVQPWTPDGVATMDDLDEVVHTNVQGTQIVTSAFMPLLQQGSKKTVMMVSSSVGSISLHKKFSMLPTPAYRISKAAMNELTVIYADEYADKGFTIFAITPGWVQTDLGGLDKADLTPAQSAKAVLERLHAVTPADNGKFWQISVPGFGQRTLEEYDGTEVPW